jgi:hypothetical protein
MFRGMDDTGEKNSGMQRLIETYRNQFQIEENLNYYSREDYRLAERKFLKFVLEKGAAMKD